jgi:hypothetical protein
MNKESRAFLHFIKSPFTNNLISVVELMYISGI